MISAHLLTLLSAASILISAMVLGLWQILSAPDRPNYPTSGAVKRAMMFGFMVMLVGRGAEMIVTLYGPAPVYSTAFQAMSSFALCGLLITFLVDHLRNWLPAKTQANIQRLYATARCAPNRGLKAARASSNRSAGAKPLGRAAMVGPALVEMKLAGASVAGPNEGPEAFTEN